jgi:L-rhamnose isomerase
MPSALLPRPSAVPDPVSLFASSCATKRINNVLSSVLALYLSKATLNLHGVYADMHVQVNLREIKSEHTTGTSKAERTGLSQIY